MARKKKISFNKTTLFCLIAIVLILGLLVALAFSPVGQGLIDGLESNGTQNSTDGNQNTNNIISLGNKVTAQNGDVLLQEIDAKIHFINVGQGDAILVQFNDGVEVLIDAGSGSSRYPSSEIKTNFLSYLNSVGIDGTLDYVIATHPDSDHVNMLSEVLEIYTVDNIMYNDMDKGTLVYNDFKADAILEVQAENLYKLDEDGEIYKDFITGVGYSFDIYAPGYSTFQDENPEFDAEESNSMSPIIVLTIHETVILLSGDATFETEEWFLNSLGTETLDVDVLKVGHHGSAGSTGESFLATINAEFAIISSDEGAAYAHPRPELMTRLFNAGVVTYRTSRHGNIIMNIDVNGDFGFSVDNEVLTENNTKGINDLMIVTK